MFETVVIFIDSQMAVLKRILFTDIANSRSSISSWWHNLLSWLGTAQKFSVKYVFIYVVCSHTQVYVTGVANTLSRSQLWLKEGIYNLEGYPRQLVSLGKLPALASGDALLTWSKALHHYSPSRHVCSWCRPSTQCLNQNLQITICVGAKLIAKLWM